MGTIPIIILIIRTLNIFFLLYIMLNNCATITIKDFYKSMFYIDLGYRFLSFVSTVIISLWKKCLKAFQLYALILTFTNYILYIIVIYSLISNFKQFNSFYYDCPYIRLLNGNLINNDTYKYKRTCINYELNQYVCFYNSTKEYINTYCDGVLCKKDKNIPEIMNKVYCSNIYMDNITQNIKYSNNINGMIIDNINKFLYNNELYLCKRKNEIDKNNKLIGNKCPDENPIKSYIFAIYGYICSCFFECSFFIYLSFYLKKLKKNLEIELKREKKRRELRQQNNNDYNCNKSDKDETKNTNQIQNNNDNVENEYAQGERILTIGIELESPEKSNDNKSNRKKIVKETNKNLIIIKSSINEEGDKENEEDIKEEHPKSKKIKRLLSEDKPINDNEAQTKDELSKKEENN